MRFSSHYLFVGEKYAVSREHKCNELFCIDTLQLDEPNGEQVLKLCAVNLHTTAIKLPSIRAAVASYPQKRSIPCRNEPFIILNTAIPNSPRVRAQMEHHHLHVY